MTDEQKTEVKKIAEAVTREVHAQFTFVEGYILATQRLSHQINELKAEISFLKRQTKYKGL